MTAGAKRAGCRCGQGVVGCLGVALPPRKAIPILSGLVTLDIDEPRQRA